MGISFEVEKIPNADFAVVSVGHSNSLYMFNRDLLDLNAFLE